jgi:uncharacterized small protein (DUF1192 family)
LGIAEYYIFDPQREYLDPPLRGHRLVNGTYQTADGLTMFSEALDLELRVEGTELRLFESQRGEYLLTPPELTERVEELDERVEELDAQLARETETRRAAEEENARLRAELERIRKQNAS